MTLRDEVRAALDGEGPAALDAIGDLAPDLVGTALGHFADTSTLADADVLAPIVTAASPVPFDPLLDGFGAEPEDEAASEIQADEDPDAFDRIDEASDAVAPVDDDPGGFDSVDEPVLDEPATVADRASEEHVETEHAAFGAGDASIDPMTEPVPLFEEAAPQVDPLQVGDESFDLVGAEIQVDTVGDVESVEVDEFDADPAHGDFDIVD